MGGGTLARLGGGPDRRQGHSHRRREPVSPPPPVSADTGRQYRHNGATAHLARRSATSIGLPATRYVYRTSIRVVAGKHSAEHSRRFERGARSILPEHRAQHLAAVSGKRGQLYLKRQHLLDLGPPALAFLTEVVPPPAQHVEARRRRPPRATPSPRGVRAALRLRSRLSARGPWCQSAAGSAPPIGGQDAPGLQPTHQGWKRSRIRCW
jgi:hypothetical protein